MRTKTMLPILMLTMLALPLAASAADLSNWSITLVNSDGTPAGSGTFRADPVPQYTTPVIDFDATVNGIRYNVEPLNSSSAFEFTFNNAFDSLFAFVLSSTGDGAIPCIGFNQVGPSEWHNYVCTVSGGLVQSAVRLATYGSYGIVPGPTGTPAVLNGFYPPVESPAVATNLAKAGQTIPLKFYAETTSGPITDLTTVDLSIIATDCGQLDEGMDAIESYSNGTSVTLQNLGSGYYQYNWKTVKGDTGCRLITLALPETYDAEAIVAAFKFRK